MVSRPIKIIGISFFFVKIQINRSTLNSTKSSFIFVIVKSARSFIITLAKKRHKKRESTEFIEIILIG